MPVPEAVWERRFAYRARRVDLCMERPELRFLQALSFCPDPPIIDNRISQNPWQWQCIRWRDRTMDLAVRLGYRA